MNCDVCGRPVTDNETHWPHDHGCKSQIPWCDCDTVTCPTCCWDCKHVEAPA